MKLVEITTRRIAVNGKMCGKGGQYEFDDATASRLVKNRDAKIIKDLGKDDTSFSVTQEESKRVERLEFIQENAHEILTILESAMKDKYGDRKDFSPDGDKESQEGAKASKANNSSSDNTGDDQDKTSDELDANKRNTEDQNKETKGTEIPDKFPSKDKLEEAGFLTLETIPRDKQKLIDAGLSERSVNAIAVRLSEIDKEEG